MAIVMISDAVEAAARAYSQEEDPTADGLQRVVDDVVDEKVADGQLNRSALTFGDLTAVKEELVRALMGYYHARVPYPGFPGPKAISAETVPAFPETPAALPDSRSEVSG
jgi:membrane-associated HD superfamily phosphohydrolase